MEKDNEKKNKKGEKIYLVITFIFFSFGMFIPFVVMGKRAFESVFNYMPLVLSDVFFALSLLLLWIHLDEKHTEERFSLYENYLSEELKSEKRSQEEKDAIGMMINNNKEIAEYFEISKKQEKTSYNISICCSVFGFAMLVIAIIGVLYEAKIEITAMTVVSSALTEVISGLVLWIHRKSSEQLNHYYGSLHENEKFLSAISLAKELSDPHKTQMYEEIIKAQIRAREENKENEK